MDELIEALKGLAADLRAALGGARDADSQQAAVDAAVANVGDVATFSRGKLMQIPTKYNLKCSGCGVVMPVAYFNAWREVSPGVWSPFCDACRPGR